MTTTSAALGLVLVFTACDSGDPHDVTVDSGDTQDVAVDSGDPHDVAVDSGDPHDVAVDSGDTHDVAVDSGDTHDVAVDSDVAIGSAVDWAPCPLYYDNRDGSPAAECATVNVPLRWSEPGGPTLGIFIQRLRATTTPARGQLWLLNGGPGGSGADFDEWMEAYGALDPTLDIYTIDHRGTGRSARLSCPAQESERSDSGFYLTASETADCYAAEHAEWGDDLAEFTTTAAARDLGRLIALTRGPTQDVFVYGVSYGTYWGHRYLQIFPDQATAVALDSLVPPTHDFVGYDAAYNQVGRDFMDLCGADDFCAGKLGADPWQAVAALFAAVDRGHCPDLVDAWGLDATTLRSVLGIFLTGYDIRVLVPAIVYRMTRCEPADVEAIGNLLTLFFGGEPELSYYDTLGSDSLFYNVTRSELWPNDEPDHAAIAAEQATLYVSTGLTPEIAATTWPAYADDAYVGAWAETDVPLLLLNGDLDPQTPLASARAMEAHFAGPHQHFVVVPRAAHGVSVNTPVPSADALPCGLSLLVDFFTDPTAAPDRACLDEIPAETFVGDPGLATFVFGVEDLWDNPR